jgi:hypothetical protein
MSIKVFNPDRCSVIIKRYFSGIYSMKPILIFCVCLVLAACVAPRPDPEILVSIDKSIQLAEAAGGDEFAPVEMRFAREKLASANLAMEKQKYEVVVYLAQEAEINAELAIEKSRTAKSRRQANELRKNNEVLHEKLVETFGDEFK